MKTHVHITNWLLRAAMMLVTLASGQAAVAQQTTLEGGEAFYIYQNDGHFDGFFYDEVKQIRYSRLDTLDREHDHYVSQEIVTEDSVYRIMLTAIDSVSFYQPEIKFAKGMRFMQDEGMMDYYVSLSQPNDDNFRLCFSGYMPPALWPKTGDVLSCPHLKDYDEAFVGKVKEMSIEGGYIFVECGYVEDISDVFEQFIAVEQVRNVQTPEGGKTRRRIAGLNAPKREEGNVDEFTLFNIGTTLEGNLVFFEKLKLGLSLGIGFGMTAKASYKFVSEEWYTKIELKDQVATNFGIQLDGELYANADLSALPGVGALVDRFTKIPLPANFPLFNIDAAPKPFTKVEAHLNVALRTGLKVSADYYKLEFQWKRGKRPSLDVWGQPIYPFLPLPSTISGDSEWSITAQLNGTLQTGIKFPIKTETENWLNKVLTLRAGADIYAGPKVSGAIDFSLLEKGGNGTFSVKEPMGFYERMKGTKVDVSLLSIDVELTAKAELIGKALGAEKKSTTSTSFGNFSLMLFPSISGLECDVTGDQMNIVTGKCNVVGEVCMPERVGFGLYKKKNETDENYNVLYRSVTRDEMYFINTFNSVDLKMEDVEPGIYKAYPIVSTIFGIVPITTEGQIITVAPQELVLKPESITAEEEGGKFEVELITSINQNLTASPDEDWIEANIRYNVGPTKATIMDVTVKENETEKFRKSGVTVTQVLKDGSICEKNLEVKQYGGLQLDVSKAEFEADGGDLIVNILTSYDPITINLNNCEDWLSYDLDGRKLTLTATKNEGIDREGTIIIAAWNKKTQGITTIELKVTQKGIVDVSVDKEELEFPANGGGEMVNITLGGNYDFTKVDVSKADQEWLTVEKHDNYFIVNAMPNTTPDERETAIVLVFTKKKTTAPGPLTYQKAIKIKQKDPTASVDRDELHFSNEGGSDKVKIEFSIYPYFGAFLDEDGADWCDVKVDPDGTVTVTVDKNPLDTDRKCTLVCYVSGKPNASVNEMKKMNVTIRQDGNTPTFTINNVLLSTVFNMRCTNANAYNEPPFEDWEPTKRAVLGFSYMNGDKDRSAVITMIDRDNLHLECTEKDEYADPDYPELVAKTENTFSVDFTKFIEVEEDEDTILHIKVSNFKHVRNYTETFGNKYYTEHSEYAVSPYAIFYTIAYPAIYNEKGTLQMHGELMWIGGSSYWGAGLTSVKYYEEYNLDNGQKPQRYEYVTDYIPENGFTLQIKFEPDSYWDKWLGGEQVDDFGNSSGN